MYQLPGPLEYLMSKKEKGKRLIRFVESGRKGLANLKKEGALLSDMPFAPNIHIRFVTILCLLTGFTACWAYFPKEVLSLPITCLEPTSTELAKAIFMNSKELFVNAKDILVGTADPLQNIGKVAEVLNEQQEVFKDQQGVFDPLNKTPSKGAPVLAIMLATILLGAKLSEAVNR